MMETSDDVQFGAETNLGAANVKKAAIL